MYDLGMRGIKIAIIQIEQKGTKLMLDYLSKKDFYSSSRRLHFEVEMRSYSFGN
jgi:hypothetical protein